MPTENTRLARIPSVDALLQTDTLKSCILKFGHTQTRDKIREVLTKLRQQLHANNVEGGNYTAQHLAATIENELLLGSQSTLSPVFNLTGTVIHTNLGRSPLANKAIEAMIRVAGACNLEFDLKDGKRGDRDDHIENLICKLTGAEAATVVNNNAAALVLVLNTLAKDRWVPVSRGELVEIGGAFRIPEIIDSAGCHIKEVGTTNRTHLKDYENAIGEKTALLLKVHTSNYSVEGFTKSVAESELATLCREKALPLVSDLGSGSIVDLQAFGLPKEPLVKEMIAAGVDVVTFSGDKLLGGPQAGIIVGKKHYIEKIKRNPLKRALRVDKLILAALEATLSLYKDTSTLEQELPALRKLSRPLIEIEKCAKKTFKSIENAIADVATVNIVDCYSQIGSGALPRDELPSKALAIKPIPKQGETDSRLTRLSLAFRQLPIPVIGRINDGVLYFDLRCLEDIDSFLDQLTFLNIKV